jgi:two-component system, NarL family, response regulator NreC
MPLVRVLLVDDSRVFLVAAAKLLESHPDIQVIGQATSGEEAVTQVCVLKPHLVVMDWEMQGMNGLQAMVIIKKLVDPPRVVLVSLHNLAEYRVTAAAYGADGFWGKRELYEQVPAMLAQAFSSSSRFT